MDIPNVVTALISAVSLLVSIIVAAISVWQHYDRKAFERKSHDETLAIERRVVEIEEQRDTEKQEKSKKAILLPEFDSNCHSHSYGEYRDTKLIIRNNGQSTAKNVKVYIDGVDVINHPKISPKTQYIKCIAPSSHFDYEFYQMNDKNLVYSITIEWEDDSGPNKSETTLSIIPKYTYEFNLA